MFSNYKILSKISISILNFQLKFIFNFYVLNIWIKSSERQMSSCCADLFNTVYRHSIYDTVLAYIKLFSKYLKKNKHKDSMCTWIHAYIYRKYQKSILLFQKCVRISKNDEIDAQFEGEAFRFRKFMFADIGWRLLWGMLKFQMKV